MNPEMITVVGDLAVFLLIIAGYVAAISAAVYVVLYLLWRFAPKTYKKIAEEEVDW